MDKQASSPPACAGGTMLYRAMSLRSFLRDEAGKSGFFQSCQHFFGVVPVGEGPHLHPEQAVPLGLRRGLLRLGRDIGSPQIPAQAPGDSLADFIGVLDEKYLPDWAREKLMELTAPRQEAPATGEMKLE